MALRNKSASELLRESRERRIVSLLENLAVAIEQEDRPGIFRCRTELNRIRLAMLGKRLPNEFDSFGS